MFTCTYLYKLQNSPAVPAPGCSFHLDARTLAAVAVTGLAPCPREPAMDQVLQHWAYIAQQVSNKAGKRAQTILEQEQKGPGEPSVFLSVSEDSLLSGHCMKNNICFGVSGSGRWNLWLRLRDARASGAWPTRQGLSLFRQCFSPPCSSIFTFGRAGMCLFLLEKPSVMPEAKDDKLYGAGLQQERKGNFPKGFE